MSQKHHIIQITNTRANLQSNLDVKQIAIETDNTENLVYADDDGTYHITANQSENATFLDVACDDCTISTGHYLLITDMTVGSVLFAGASGSLSQDNASLFWDNSNKRLGVGTATPVSLGELSSATAPLLTLTALTDTATVDPMMQYRVGATPAVVACHGVDNSDSDAFKIRVGDGTLSSGQYVFTAERLTIPIITGTASTAGLFILDGSGYGGCLQSMNYGGTLTTTFFGNNRYWDGDNWVALNARAGCSFEMFDNGFCFLQFAAGVTATFPNRMTVATNGLVGIGGNMNLTSLLDAGLVATTGQRVYLDTISGALGEGLYFATQGTAYNDRECFAIQCLDTGASSTKYNIIGSNRHYTTAWASLNTQAGAAILFADNVYYFYQFAAGSNTATTPLTIDANGTAVFVSANSPQVTIGYDAGSYMSVAVANGSATVFDLAESATFTFNKGIGIGAAPISGVPNVSLNIINTGGQQLILTDSDVNASGENWYIESVGGSLNIGNSTAADGTYATLLDRARFAADGAFLIPERASAGADVTGWGQWWVKNTAPNAPFFTDDAGNDFELLGCSAVTSETVTADRTLTVRYAGHVYKLDALYVS